MKAIQSFWSKPSFSNMTGNDNRNYGGWRTTRQYFMSWALSCMRLSNYYDEIELYTDTLGKELLIQKLKLPYSRVHLDLNSLNSFNAHLWTYGKIQVYGKQTQPFIHFDSDIFTWKSLSHLGDAPVIAQNLENNQSYYRPVISVLIDSFNIPTWLKDSMTENHSILVSNTGIMGGHDNSFISNYSSLAIEIFHANLNNLSKINQGAFSVTIEQYVLYALAKKEGITIKYLIEEDLNYSKNPSIIKLYNAPNRETFIHPLSTTFKSVPSICLAIEQNLRTEFPEVYYRIEALCKSYALV